MRIYAGEDDDGPLERVRIAWQIFRDYRRQDLAMEHDGDQRWMVPRGPPAPAVRARRNRWVAFVARPGYLSGFSATLILTSLMVVVAPDRTAWLGATSAALAIFNAFASLSGASGRGNTT